MVIGWRRAFCTSVSKDRDKHQDKIATDDQTQQNTPPPPPPPPLTSEAIGSSTGHRSPRFVYKFNFFTSSSSASASNPSTPKILTPPASKPATAPVTPASASPACGSPRLHCKTGRSSSRFFQRSNPSSPRSPSPFSLLKKTLRISKTRCGVCTQIIKTGQGTAIFTAECSHSFHFPCLASTIAKHGGGLACPVCGSKWKEVPLLKVHKPPQPQPQHRPKQNQTPESNQSNTNSNKKYSFKESASFELKVYNDDEPLMCAASGGVGRFNPIPESDENEEGDGNEEFLGFHKSKNTPMITTESISHRDIEARILPDAAVISVGRNHETYVAVLKIKAPPAQADSRRAPVDLVALIDVGGEIPSSNLQITKRAVRSVISCLSSTDRLSIVAFSSSSKRLLPLRRMTPSGRRSARRIVDSLVSSHGSCVNDAMKKAAKVLEDRRERNPACGIFLFSKGDRNPSPLVSSTRFSNLDIPVHAVSVGALAVDQSAEAAFVNSVPALLTVVAIDLRLNIKFSSGPAPVQIMSVYSCTGRPSGLNPGSARLGDLYAEEEREILIELRVPVSSLGAQHLLCIRSSFKAQDQAQNGSHVQVQGEERILTVPHAAGIRSTGPGIRRLRSMFMMTRAVAESRRLSDRGEWDRARDMLTSARGVVMTESEEWVRGVVEAEMAEVERRSMRRRRRVGTTAGEREEVVLTPTSAWRAAERLAKVAMMRKSLTRVSDLHGLENARF